MSDLLALLSSARTSLAAYRSLTATASHNINNADNPGYARQIASLETMLPADRVSGGYVGRGATLGAVTQARDPFLEAQLPRALGSAAFSAEQSRALQAFHGLDPASEGGLGEAISGFYSSLRRLAQNPGDSGLRATALGSTRALAQAFNRTAQQVDAARSGLDAQVASLASSVAAEARAVAELNVQIPQASTAGVPNDLLDLRQKHLDRLAELVGATTVPAADGTVNVVLPGGLSLVSGSRAATISTRPDVANGGHLQVLLAPPDGGAAQPLPGAVIGGAVGGVLAARDGALREAGDQLDQLAFDLAGALDVANGFDPATGAGPRLFAARAGVAGAAARLAVADPPRLAPLDPASPGDPATVLRLVETERAPVAGFADVQSALSGIVSQFGASAEAADAFAGQDAAVKENLTRMRDAYSGVSIDEEMITLQAVQRGYEAIAKVIQTADQMMQTLMGLVR
jgi:flagellar hook-associated protein 1 FlgK